jgi:hypothetical protein
MKNCPNCEDPLDDLEYTYCGTCREMGCPIERTNPEGWREADGVALPPITWADIGE